MRRSVPPELRSIIGKREIRKTLGTKDVREGKRLAMQMATEVERLFASARGGIELSMTDAETLAAAWKAEALAESADAFASETKPRSWEEIEYLIEAWRPFGEAERQALATREENPYIVSQAKKLLAKQGVALATGSVGFRRLCFALHKALIDVQDANGERLRGVWNSEKQAQTPIVIAPAISPLMVPAPRSRRIRKDGKPNATLPQVLDRWAKDRKPRKRTLQEFRTCVRRFNESVGSELRATMLRSMRERRTSMRH